MNGSSDTSRSGEAPALLDDLPPGIAWLRGPDPRLPAPAGSDLPEIGPGQVLSRLIRKISRDVRAMALGETELSKP